MLKSDPIFSYGMLYCSYVDIKFVQLGVRVCVSHLPLFYCEVCPGLFTTPPHSALFPLLPSDVETIQARLINEVTVHVPVTSYLTIYT